MLGLTKNSSESHVKSHYRWLALRNHEYRCKKDCLPMAPINLAKEVLLKKKQ